MKIKRIFAKDMRQALRLVREEHGADAVILSNRAVNGGVEVVSAIDFDQAEIEQAFARQKMAAAAAEPAPAKAIRTSRADTVANVAGAPAHRGPEPDPIYAQPRDTGGMMPSFASQLRRISTPGSSSTQGSIQGSIQGSTLDSMPGSAPGSARASAPGPDRSARPMPEQAAEQNALRAHQRIDIRLDDELDDAHEAAVHSAMHVAESRHKNSDTGLNTRASRSPLADLEWTQEPAIREMRGELKTLRSLFENQLNMMDWQKRGQKHPNEMLLLRSLTELGFGSDVCRQVATKVGQVMDRATGRSHPPELALRHALAIISRHLKVTGDDILEHGGVVAMIGPTGVGKTTTVAKLAARFALRHGRQHVGLVSTDNFRIGAQDQLRNFGRILCVPIHTANTAEELGEVLKGFADKRLVLIDTAGMSQRDLRLAEQFSALTRQKRPIRNYLVLSASTQLATMSETVKAYKQAGLSGCVLTKMDEAASLGPALTVMLRHKLPAAYLGVGQRVPEDLQTARSDKLVERAVAMVQDRMPTVDEDDLALTFGAQAI